MAASGGDAKLFARVGTFRRKFNVPGAISPLLLFPLILAYLLLMCPLLDSGVGYPESPHHTYLFPSIAMFTVIKIGNEVRYVPSPANRTDSAYLLSTSADRADKIYIQGKVAELRLELNSGGKKDKNHSAKKIALKKIVANMTMSNNDMVALFPDIVGCMQIPSLEIKKMYV